MHMKAVVAAFAATLMSGCTAHEANDQAVHKQLIVTGSEAGVRRFVALQNSRRPTLPVSSITFEVGGPATAVVALPSGYSGRELVNTTREALAAGLSYKYEEVTGAAQAR